jgi:hypothetical protein
MCINFYKKKIMTNFLFHSIHFLHTPQSYDKYYVYKLCISQKIYSSNSSLRKKVMHITRHHWKNYTHKLSRIESYIHNFVGISYKHNSLLGKLMSINYHYVKEVTHKNRHIKIMHLKLMCMNLFFEIILLW